ncbi:MAG: hypothetical protein FWD64_02240 [Acidobacteriaceae bacterium]|nr:hypothetical protein [Acidobacteriaceae bacterium]
MCGSRETVLSGNLQSQILCGFTVLHRLREDWRGAIVLSLGLDAALPFASSIAGAVSLVIDDDPSRMQQAIRTGVCDFVVTTLDEALRVMKNEVRKHTSIVVGLHNDVIGSLDEILERGLVPQLFTSFLPPDENASVPKATDFFRSHGAILVDFGEGSTSGFQSSRSLLEATMQEAGWQLHNFAFDSHESLRAFDARAAALIPPEDTLRRRWMEGVPRVLHRQRPRQRSLWLTESERIAIG